MIFLSILNFNPRSPSGLRPRQSLSPARIKYFNPRSPSGLRHNYLMNNIGPNSFQSTQPEWAATSVQAAASLHVENFNPRSPSGLRPRVQGMCYLRKNFNPRSPSGLRHCYASFEVKCSVHFNPRNPSGLRPVMYTLDNGYVLISIHAARVGCDQRP